MMEYFYSIILHSSIDEEAEQQFSIRCPTAVVLWGQNPETSQPMKLTENRKKFSCEIPDFYLFSKPSFFIKYKTDDI